MSRPTPEFSLNQIDDQQAQESAQLIFLALELRRLGTEEDVLWAQELTKQMPQKGDAGSAWWAEQVRERLAQIGRS